MNSYSRGIALMLCIGCVLLGTAGSAQAGIVGTKHDLSYRTGPAGPDIIKALPSNPNDGLNADKLDRICIFCHTPHNANPQTPLWNRKLSAVNYALYNSTTMAAIVTQPSGPSRLCLSCHDGTLALGELLTRVPGTGEQPNTTPTRPWTISLTNTDPNGSIPSSHRSNLGSTLSRDHPVSFSYFSSLPNPELSPNPLSTGLLFYGNGVIHCSTCHDPHENQNKKFLRVDNTNSALCTLCHSMNGWNATSMNTNNNASAKDWNFKLPNPWPWTGIGTDFGWDTVQKNGCENCHTPHSASSPSRLLKCGDNATPPYGLCAVFNNEGNCYPCHNGNVASKNIIAQLDKSSHHRTIASTIAHDPLENPRLGSYMGHVECVDCHNPHMANNSNTGATPPSVSGRLIGVSGVTINDLAVNPATNEYEICFKCHSSASANVQSIGYPVQRWASPDYNTRLEFQTTNPSFHPVAGPGKSSDVPSLLAPMKTSSMIFCSDCHGDDGGVSRGPHGSNNAPLLRDPYKTTNDNTPYVNTSFKLCFDCHEETYILSNNAYTTFLPNVTSGKGGHIGHVQNPLGDHKGGNGLPYYAPCSACHDPHGVRDDGLSGSHKRLINFDSQIVSVLPGSGFTAPIFSGQGNRSGNCALVCHDASGKAVVHDGSLKYSYGGAAAIGPGTIYLHW